MNDQNYFNKIAILIIATFANIFILWYFVIREESSDWIAAQVVHQVSPYVVTEESDGLTVNNVIMGYEFKLPEGFKTVGARNFSFYMEEGGQKKCEIKHYYINAKRAEKILSEGGKVVFLLNNVKLVFELTGTETEKAVCAKYLKQIEDSIIMN